MPFNSLSRDHESEFIEACYKTWGSYFQLPLSGSPPRLPGLPRSLLSTPSLGITIFYSPDEVPVNILFTFNSLSRDHFGNAIRLFSSMTRLSTPSLGITHRGTARNGNPVCPICFQLPLSGSRLDPERPRMFAHLWCFQLPLSGSLISVIKALMSQKEYSFNSLSRDHFYRQSESIRKNWTDFQLPLSGSPQLLNRVEEFTRFTLSTPSLGITRLNVA